MSQYSPDVINALNNAKTFESNILPKLFLFSYTLKQGFISFNTYKYIKIGSTHFQLLDESWGL